MPGTIQQLIAKRTAYGYDIWHGRTRLCVLAQPIYELEAGIRPTHEAIRQAVRETHPDRALSPSAWVHYA